MQNFFRKLSPAKVIAQERGGEHDKHILDYKDLMSDPDGILGQLEEVAANPIDAQKLLGEIFMVC